MAKVSVGWLALATSLLACPPARRSGSGDDDDAAGDDDTSEDSIGVGGAAYWYPMYEDRVDYAQLLITPGVALACDDFTGGDWYYQEEIEDWVSLTLYRGVDVPWTGTYTSTYDYDGKGCGWDSYDDDDDGSMAHCLYGSTSEGYVDSDVVLEIDAWGGGGIRGSLRTGLIDLDFEVRNCGEYDPYSDYPDDDSAYRDRGHDGEGERSPSPANGSSPRGGWRLRFR